MSSLIDYINTGIRNNVPDTFELNIYIQDSENIQIYLNKIKLFIEAQKTDFTKIYAVRTNNIVEINDISKLKYNSNIKNIQLITNYNNIIIAEEAFFTLDNIINNISECNDILCILVNGEIENVKSKYTDIDIVKL